MRDHVGGKKENVSPQRPQRLIVNTASALLCAFACSAFSSFDGWTVSRWLTGKTIETQRAQRRRGTQRIFINPFSVLLLQTVQVIAVCKFLEFLGDILG